MAKVSNRNQILAFLAGTFLLTIPIQLYIIKEAKTYHTFALLFLMWVPGAVGIACSHYFKNRYRELALVKPGRFSVIFAYAVPAGAAILTTLLLTLIDVAKFKFPEGSFFRLLIFDPTIGVLVAGLMALGEELGWRGFLQDRLMRAHIPEPLLVTGVLWSVWHWPLILFLDYSTSPMPWFSVLLFTVQTTSFAVFLGWLREFSKSIWPCVLANAVHTTWIVTIMPAFYTPGRMHAYFGGESGFVLAIIYLMVAMYIYRKHPVGHY